MATIQREIRKRGFFGKIVKFLFIAFNLLMLVWIISYFSDIGGLMKDATNDAERAGGAIGASIGTGLLLLVWTMRTVILGFAVMLTKGQKIIVTEER